MRLPLLPRRASTSRSVAQWPFSSTFHSLISSPEPMSARSMSSTTPAAASAFHASPYAFFHRRHQRRRRLQPHLSTHRQQPPTNLHTTKRLRDERLAGVRRHTIGGVPEIYASLSVGPTAGCFVHRPSCRTIRANPLTA